MKKVVFTDPNGREFEVSDMLCAKTIIQNSFQIFWMNAIVKIPLIGINISVM